MMAYRYTSAEDKYLRDKAAADGRSFDLILGSDGVYRTPEEHLKWLKDRQVGEIPG